MEKNTTGKQIGPKDLAALFQYALKTRIANHNLSVSYQHLFSEVFIDSVSLGNVLLYYKTVFAADRQDWFRQFHKSIRQCDFFPGEYLKLTDVLTQEQRERRLQILDTRHEARRKSPDIEPPFTKELRDLNALAYKTEPVPLAGIADSLLYNLIHLDKSDELRKAMEATF